LAAHEALGLDAADHDPARDNQSCQAEWENARRCFARILDRLGLLAPKLEDFVPLLIGESIQVWPCLNGLRAGLILFQPLLDQIVGAAGVTDKTTSANSAARLECSAGRRLLGRPECAMRCASSTDLFCPCACTMIASMPKLRRQIRERPVHHWHCKDRSCTCDKRCSPQHCAGGGNIANTGLDQLHPDLPPLSDDARPKKLRRIYARSRHPAFFLPAVVNPHIAVPAHLTIRRSDDEPDRSGAASVLEQFAKITARVVELGTIAGIWGANASRRPSRA
jgi:hypothetical protein